MLRITHATTGGGNPEGVLLRLEGEITGPWVEELRRVCHDAVSHNGHGARALVIDLTDVFFIDAKGIALFRELATRRVLLRNCSLFVTEQLKEVENANE